MLLGLGGEGAAQQSSSWTGWIGLPDDSGRRAASCAVRCLSASAGRSGERPARERAASVDLVPRYGAVELNRLGDCLAGPSAATRWVWRAWRRWEICWPARAGPQASSCALGPGGDGVVEVGLMDGYWRTTVARALHHRNRGLGSLDCPALSARSRSPDLWLCPQIARPR
jgi:hypothetical protein